MLSAETNIKALVDIVVKEGASDLHLSEGRSPVIRVSGFLIPLVKMPSPTKEDIEGYLSLFLTPDNHKEFLLQKEVNFAYTSDGKNRFRGNAFQELGKISIALRLVPSDIRTFAELNLPQVLETFAAKQQGFPELWVPRAILVTRAIPVLGNGKIDYGSTRELAASRRALL